MDLFRKLFLDADWDIAFRKRESFVGDTMFSYRSEFKLIPSNSKYWIADPMLFESQGKTFLFCEAYEKQKEIGRIGVFEYVNNQFSDLQVIIEEPFHLSYPNVFYYNDEYFMIPETAEAHMLYLYRATDFPLKWERVAILKEDIEAADPTVFEMDGRIFLCEYESVQNHWDLNFFELDMEVFQLKAVNTIQYDKNVGRPAGYISNVGEKFYRPAQENQTCYGKQLLLYELRREKNTTLFFEDYVTCVDNDRVVVDGKCGIDRIHTFTFSSSIEVIDFSIFSFDLLKRFKIIRSRKIKRSRRNASKD